MVAVAKWMSGVVTGGRVGWTGAVGCGGVVVDGEQSCLPLPVGKNFDLRDQTAPPVTTAATRTVSSSAVAVCPGALAETPATP